MLNIAVNFALLYGVYHLVLVRKESEILRDICVEGAVWETGAHMNPLKLRRQDLTPLARGWHDFIIHNIKPTSNQSEVTVERAVLIHCIITSQEVEVEEIIEDTMTNIISKLHLSKPPLAFPNVIARLLEESGEEQAQLQRDFSNYRKKFSTHMSKTHKSFEEQGKQMEEINDLLSHNTWHTKSHQMYSNRALQQMNPALTPILPRHIPFRIQSNVNEDRPMFDGMLHPWLVGGESSAAATAAPP
ncbi:hypothetical protein PIB30_075117 [Stylosanthes scabra]|uniref:Putative plant transposon protein domain-containing protein n=1 Tax=Stylosanthes scabra TaxID=79078 RepID=A0ABU6XQ73_9FABA|nr:hypothetical protein [Stylosanthes scabra]